MAADQMWRKRQHAKQSSALVIVLFFVLLISVVAIAFLSRSLTAVKASAGSAGEITSKILAASASDIIIGDFKQEIIAGSTNNAGGSNPNSGTPNFPVYIPTSNLTAIPWMNGVPMSGGTNAIPNLICRSVSPANLNGTAPYAAYSGTYNSSLIPSNRAANDSSAASPTLSSTAPFTTSKVNSSYPSLNGRYISPSQWNSHYLIPRNTSVDAAGSTNLDSTPVANFVTPDWVIVTRNGATSVSATSPGFPTTGGGLNDATLSNNNYAVGRYAYAVYNEGGLLDMNAAGYPGSDSVSTGLTATQISKKGTLALADLTQLAAGSVNLTQTQINNIVGWRNYASVQPPTLSGTFGGYTFSAANASNWTTNFTMTPVTISGTSTYVMGNTNSFLQIVPPPSGANATPTDQAILSRQQLISLVQSLSISPDFLQYMGTFSRALEQPSYAPNPNLPKIVGTATPPAPVTAYGTPFTTYQGNNTYWGGESAINLRGAGGFLGARVTTSFTRLDGTTAIVGEPLVKRKFALSRLALVTDSATNTNTSGDKIWDRFGIYRSSSTSPWVYNHGSSTIMTLSQVAALSGANAREPDFAELLKAAINAGSVGKAGPSGQGVNDQYVVDASGDVQILQIMANLIDQQKTTNFPTWIQYTQSTSTGNITRNIYGDQDLPYFYRWNYFNFTTTLPAPLLTGTNTVTITTPADGPITHSSPGSYATQGLACSMIVPEVWNPHDANMPIASGGGPTVFRIQAITNLPSYLPTSTLTTTWTINAIPSANANLQFDGGGNGEANCPSSLIPAATPLTALSSTTPVTASTTNAIQFTDYSGGSGIPGKAFREPTILWRNNYPSGVALVGPSRTDAVSNNTYYGILVGDKVPISWNWTGGDGKPYFSQASVLMANSVAGPPGSNKDNIDFLMQYNTSPTGTGTWITYQETYLESSLKDYPSYGIFVNKAEYTKDEWENPFQTPVNSASPPFARPESGIFDPRTNRFTAPCLGRWISNPALDAVTTGGTKASNDAVGSSNFVLLATTRPTSALGQLWPYTTPCRNYDSGDAGGGQSSHWYSSPHGTTTAGAVGGNWNMTTDANFYDGLLSQNNWLLQLPSGDGTSAQLKYYYEDPDGIARRAMAGYIPVSGNASAGQTNMTNQSVTTGLPTVTSGTTFTNGIVAPTTQSQSRPILLHRPYRSVAEMSYAFRGTPWKNIDFFTPESGDSALLDVFCINEPPSNAMVAGKVDLNTRQVPVLKAIFSSAYRDEFANITTPPTGTLPPLSSTEAGNLASTLVGITTSANSWEGPLASVADVVGHFVYPDPGALSATDVYQYTSPANNTEYTFSGFTAALSGTSVWDSSNLTSSQYIQRFRESAIRPLADCGQTRVWNLLIDVVAQSGRYPKTASSLDQFVVTGQSHLWVHVAIDRYTGQVVDKQVEVVTP